LPNDALRIVAKGEKEDKSPEFAPTIRISITCTALEAIASTLPLGSVGFDREAGANGERLVWLEAVVVEGSWLCAGQARAIAT
jgi:hypothetical protein